MRIEKTDYGYRVIDERGVNCGFLSVSADGRLHLRISSTVGNICEILGEITHALKENKELTKV